MGVPVVAVADEPAGGLSRLADRIGQVAVGTRVQRIAAAVSTRTRPQPPPVVHAALAAGIR